MSNARQLITGACQQMTVEDCTQHTKVTVKQACHSTLGFNKCHNSDFAFVKLMMTAAYVIWHSDIAQIHPGKIRSQSLCNFTWTQRLSTSCIIIGFAVFKYSAIAHMPMQDGCSFRAHEKTSRSDVDLPYSAPVHHYCPEWKWP